MTWWWSGVARRGSAGPWRWPGHGVRYWWSMPHEPRNAPADRVHNYLGREGTPPSELLAVGRAEVAAYGGSVVNGRVVSARRRTGDRGRQEGFDVALADGTRVKGATAAGVHRAGR